METTYKTNQEKEDQEFIPIGTKIIKQWYPILSSIFTRMGTSVYAYLQRCLEIIVLLRCGQYDITEDLMHLIRNFNGYNDPTDGINILDRGDDNQIIEAIYVIGNPSKKGRRLVKVSESLMGSERTYTYNLPTIFEEMCQYIFQGNYYRKLRNYGIDVEANSAFEAMQKLLDEQPDNQEDRDLIEMFQDNDYMDNGKRLERNRTKSTRDNSQQLWLF